MNFIKNIVLTLIVVLMITPNAHAMGVGDAFPSFSLKDQDAVVKTYDDVKGKRGTVFVFVRSADWCPYCQVQLLDLKSDADPIIEEGYSIVAVSYDTPDKLKRFTDKYSFPYTMLSDEDSENIKALGILNDDYAKDHFAYGVPNPTVYVVSPEGIISDKLSEEGYKKRPQVEAILDAVKN